MRSRNIYSVYSSNDVCSVIQASCASLPTDVSLRLNSVSSIATKKKFLTYSSRISQEKGDLVIVIERGSNYVFKKNAQSPRLLHFDSYSSFAAWIDNYQIHNHKG